MTDSTRHASVSVVIPAHDEARGIRANLTELLSGLPAGTLDVVVVCNGCTDDTAAEARTVAGVRVLEIPEASKARAVEVGNHATDVFPRVHLDADVTLAGPAAVALADAVRAEGVHAAGPARIVPLEASSWPVRAYYEVWEQLPHVRGGLFGRGAVALSAAGQERVDAFAGLMGDDLAMSEAFAEQERRVVDRAVVVVRPPRTVRDLLRRRTRVVTGNAQFDGASTTRSSTSVSTLVGLARHDRRVALRLPVFLGISLRARWGARKAVRAADFTTWLRDESSRA
ncbi:glycosyltransferase [Nocardioides sp. CER19]|uniref:glycosyltransferase n=1 Tax=Nocardioides sp. CER19 TaxID=3038538 RepID=UPI00244D348C|nr:glycosyltransferase [Nocardioides sp. CER19]MDH2414817.1 glycosyltransferase [Nocardioides sp. CER19]